MIKILFFHHGDTKGGAPLSLKGLLENLDRNVFNSIVVCRSSINDTIFFKEICKKTVFCSHIKPFHGSVVSGISFKQILYNFIYAIPTFFAARSLILKYKPDIIYLNSTCLFMCAFAAKMTDNYSYVICHIREPLLSNIWGKILRIMNLKFCDKFISIDVFDGKSVDKTLKKTTVIYNFVDFNVFDISIKSNILRTELRIRDNAVIFLVMARLSKENGIIELIEQWARLIHDYNSQLVIIGEIPGREVKYTSACHKLANNKLNIHILPFREDVPEVISSADIIICPFTQPHFARSIIEGAAMGKPALSNYIDGPKELIKNSYNGFFYYDDDSLKSIVKELTYDALLREKLGKNAELFAKEKFDAYKNSMKIIDILNIKKECR